MAVRLDGLINRSGGSIGEGGGGVDDDLQDIVPVEPDVWVRERSCIVCSRPDVSADHNKADFSRQANRKLAS